MMALSIVWFILIAVLWIMYLFLEGFDFGVGMLIRVVGKTPAERTAAVRTIGPHWDGNEVWLLTAGGATFAAFPLWYATMFSGMYLALFLILVLLIVRICALEWRSKVDSAKWRHNWDTFQIVASYGVPLVLGVAFSNLVQGMHIEAQTPAVVDGSLQMTTIAPTDVQAAMDAGNIAFNLTGGFLSLFTPFTVLGGLMLVAVCMAHGAQYLALKTEGEMRQRAIRVGARVSLVAVALAAVWGVWGQLAYSHNVLSWIPLVIAAVALILAAVNAQIKVQREGWAFTFSAIGVAAAVAWVFSTMAPYVMKSSVDQAYSLSIAWASSTHPTLVIMTVVAAVLVPIVLAYTAWSYWVFRGRVSVDSVDSGTGLLPDWVRPKANFLTGKKPE